MNTWGYSSAGSPVEAVTHPSEKLNKKYSAHPFIWGYSSAGRALEWHSRGQRFDPAYLHQTLSVLSILKKPASYEAGFLCLCRKTAFRNDIMHKNRLLFE